MTELLVYGTQRILNISLLVENATKHASLIMNKSVIEDYQKELDVWDLGFPKVVRETLPQVIEKIRNQHPLSLEVRTSHLARLFLYLLMSIHLFENVTDHEKLYFSKLGYLLLCIHNEEFSSDSKSSEWGSIQLELKDNYAEFALGVVEFASDFANSSVSIQEWTEKWDHENPFKDGMHIWFLLIRIKMLGHEKELQERIYLRFLYLLRMGYVLIPTKDPSELNLVRKVNHAICDVMETLQLFN